MKKGRTWISWLLLLALQPGTAERWNAEWSARPNEQVEAKL